MNAPLAASAVAVLVLNLPFGYWRAGTEKFSRAWFLAVHTPVPVVIAIRVLAHLGWHFITFPVLVGAFFVGQLAGGVLRREPRGRPDL
jgi:hypothetical protein